MNQKQIKSDIKHIINIITDSFFMIQKLIRYIYAHVNQISYISVYHLIN